MKISVLTPSFNSGKYLQRAINSVVSQSYKDWEHIIMDGASTDETIEVLKKNPHVIWESAPDKGQSDAMNKAFSKSTGEIIIYLNADDELEPDIFARIVDWFRQHPDDDMIVGNLKINELSKVRISKPSVFLRTILNYERHRFPLNAVSYAYRRELQQRVGDFPIDNHYTMDYWFLLRAYLFGRIAKWDTVHGTFYFDGSNKSADYGRAMAQLKIVRNDFLRKYFYKPSVTKYIIKSLLGGYAEK